MKLSIWGFRLTASFQLRQSRSLAVAGKMQGPNVLPQPASLKCIMLSSEQEAVASGL